MTTEQEILKKVSEAVTEKPVLIKLKREPKTGLEKWVVSRPKLHRFLSRFGLFQTEKIIKVKALTLGTLYRVSAAINELEVARPAAQSINDWIFSIMEKNALLLCEILAAAIHNDKSETPQSLIDWVFEHMTPADLAAAMAALKENIDITNFINTIVSVRSLNILIPEETSQPNTGETIALGRESGPQ